MIQTLYLNRQHSGLARNQKLSNSYLDTGSRVLSDPPNKLQNGTFKKEKNNLIWLTGCYINIY